MIVRLQHQGEPHPKLPASTCLPMPPAVGTELEREGARFTVIRTSINLDGEPIATVWLLEVPS